MKKLFLLLTCLVTFIGYTQNNYQEGYYIEKSGNTVQGFVYDTDWANSPKSIKFKHTLTAEEQLIKIENIIEFGIKNRIKFKKFNVNIDVSKSDTGNLSHSRNPVFEEKELLLEQIIAGKASLYLYEEGSQKKYFYSINNSNPEQLIFKEFYYEYPKIAQNKYFQNQIWDNLKCDKITMERCLKLKYELSDLQNIFNDYNKSVDTNYQLVENKKTKLKFNISILPGMAINSISVNNIFGSNDENHTILSPRIGVEFEALLPFNNNKWSLFFEPSFSKFEKELEYNSYYNTIFNITTPYKYSILYSAIQLNFGFRHQMFLNNKSSLFLEAMISNDNVSKKSGINNNNKGVYYFNKAFFTQFSVGYNFKDKYSMKVRFGMPGIISSSLNEYTYFTKYNNVISVIMGYKLF